MSESTDAGWVQSSDGLWWSWSTGHIVIYYDSDGLLFDTIHRPSLSEVESMVKALQHLPPLSQGQDKTCMYCGGVTEESTVTSDGTERPAQWCRRCDIYFGYATLVTVYDPIDTNDCLRHYVKKRYGT